MSDLRLSADDIAAHCGVTKDTIDGCTIDKHLPAHKVGRRSKIKQTTPTTAPFEPHTPVLRVSPHVDTTAEELETFNEALAEATELSS